MTSPAKIEHTPTRFNITWCDGRYLVSIPNYNGGDVVDADVADALANDLNKLRNSHADLRETMKGATIAANIAGSLLKEKDARIADLVKALEEIIKGAPETEPDRGDYDFSNSGDVTDYGIALEQFASAKIARTALSNSTMGREELAVG